LLSGPLREAKAVVFVAFAAAYRPTGKGILPCAGDGNAPSHEADEWSEDSATTTRSSGMEGKAICGAEDDRDSVDTYDDDVDEAVSSGECEGCTRC
jgi:hypothetical protein